MKIVVSRSAGFCMGVKRAIETALSVAGEEGTAVYTYGPLIHNPQELEMLRGKGVVALKEGSPIPSAPVIVRAHGVSPAVREVLEARASRLVDATCPKVSQIQERIRDYSQRGYAVVIAGDRDHPEVEGLVGCAGESAFVLNAPAEVDALPPLERAVLVAQTTQDEENWRLIRERFLARFPRGEALDTICSSTHRRQSELRRMLGKVEGMVVVGGRNSANTRRLYEISREAGVPAWHVESAGELPLAELKKLAVVGVTAGASTPQWIIDEVVERLRQL